MKKVLLTTISAMVLSIFSFSSKAQEVTTDMEAKPSLADIAFDKEVHDYGNIKQGGNGVYEFKFKNTGKEPLIITSAHGSCGCTVPEWPKQPIKPGETSVIKVSYDTKRVGPINKTVTINSNAKTSAVKVLRITGNIEAAPEDASPVRTNSPAAPVEKH